MPTASAASGTMRLVAVKSPGRSAPARPSDARADMATRLPAARRRLEQHGRGPLADAHDVEEAVQIAREPLARGPAYERERGDEPILGRRRGARQHGASGRRQRDLEAARVVRGARARDEPAARELRDDDRYGALVRERARRELVDRERAAA